MIFSKSVPGAGRGRHHHLGGGGPQHDAAHLDQPQGHRRPLRRFRVPPLRREADRHHRGGGHRGLAPSHRGGLRVRLQGRDRRHPDVHGPGRLGHGQVRRGHRRGHLPGRPGRPAGVLRLRRRRGLPHRQPGPHRHDQSAPTRTPPTRPTSGAGRANPTRPMAAGSPASRPTSSTSAPAPRA